MNSIKEVESRRSNKSKKAKYFGNDYYTLLIDENPKTYQEATIS